MEKMVLVIAFVLFISGISAVCNEGQIDINSANLEDLDKLIGVGPVIAKNIIDARPYETLDDLTKASGIGDVKLANIKSQGLACVGDDISSDEEEIEEDVDDIDRMEEKDTEDKEKKSNSIQVAKITGNIVSEPEIEEKPLEIIRLGKDIKSENVKEGSKAIYWLGGFVVLLGVLFLIRSRRQKTEFDD